MGGKAWGWLNEFKKINFQGKNIEVLIHSGKSQKGRKINFLYISYKIRGF